MSTAVFSTQAPWIISRRDDLLFFSGSAILGYALVLIGFGFGYLPLAVFSLYGLLVDGPHIYSSHTRALLDRDERSRLRWLWLIGAPASLITAYAIISTFGSLSYLVVIVITNWHVSKQHMGFVMIYKNKAREREDYKLDKYFTLISLMLPFFFFVSAFWFKTSLLPVFLIPALGFAGYYAWHQFRKPAINSSKLILVAAFIPLHWLAWIFAAGDPWSPMRLAVVGVALTVGHGLQYLRLMYFHNNNRYRERSGILGLVSRKYIYFACAVMVLSFPVSLNLSRVVQTRVLGVFLLGALLFHFVLDTKIWRVRGNPELARALNL